MNAAGLPTTEDELVPPSAQDVAEALAAFAEAVRGHYGDRLQGLYLFGSRARGDHRPNSDADVAVVLADGDWTDWRERSTLVGLAYEPGFDCGLLIQPWPVSSSIWAGRRDRAPAFVRTALRDAVALGDPA